MKWLTIPQFIPNWLCRYPLLLTQVLVFTNLVLQPAPTRFRDKFLVPGVMVFLGLFVLVTTVLDGRAALVVEAVLQYGGAIAAVTGLYALTLVSKLLRKHRTAQARSWLIATPLVRRHSKGMMAVYFATAFFWRGLVVLIAILILSFDTSVTLELSLRLALIVSSGASVGVALSWALSYWQLRPRYADSRYTPRPTRTTNLLPSSKALSLWPIAQAYAWSRPQNMRILLAAALLTLPAGMGILASLAILVSWVVGSYLLAVLFAVPYVAQEASAWLRATPMSFREFAWPIAQKPLLHHLYATLAGVMGSILAGSPLLSSVYLGVLWMTMVLTIAAISLADCYRARSPKIKIAVFVVGVLLIEQRVQAWVIAVALLIFFIHLGAGTKYERA